MANATQTLKTQGGLLFIHAQTALHPGSGTALGTVDLPVQRERHTGWPNIAGSALKGVLRDAYREKVRQETQKPRKVVNEEDPDVVTIFGPGKVEESSAHAGALTVSDARILAYPVRSLRGVFAWVTCRGVMERLCRDLDLTGMQPPQLPTTWPAEHKALVPTKSPLLVGQSAQATIVLEEFDYKVTGPSDSVAEWLANHAVVHKFAQDRMKSHLVVLSDDDFTHFVRNATEIVARIALDYERKTVKEGALFYQEFLPAETIMYSVLLANSSRNSKTSMDAADVLHKVRKCLEEVRVLQIGGDETTGKGLCAVHVLT
jgi:CRISPR-associated protein Cmr4